MAILASVRFLRDAIRLAGVVVAGVLSRRPVRPLGDEARRPLPGDGLLPEAKIRWTHGITIRARPAEIWPWLVQMGCRRAGWYSYDGLDNGGVSSADRIVPEFQRVEVGDVFPWTPKATDGFIVLAVEPERALVLGGDGVPVSWVLVLEPIDGTTTRLLTRGRGNYERFAIGLMLRLVWRPIHFGMQRRQLLNLKRRVEAARRDTCPSAASLAHLGLSSEVVIDVKLRLRAGPYVQPAGRVLPWRR